MTRLFIILAILISILPVYAGKAEIASNAEALVGTWEIRDGANTLIDSIKVNLSLAKKKFARFSYEQNSITDSNNSLQGFLVDDNVVIFNLIELGSVKTYIARIDFTSSGGPGIELSSRLADCTVVGQDTALVKSKNSSRLADDSAQCDGTALNDVVETAIKIVKQGTDPAAISTSGSIDGDLLSRELNVDERLSGAWEIRGKKVNKRRFIVKDIDTTHFGHEFVYRIIDNKTKLLNLNQSNFRTGLRTGYLIGDFLVLNASTFAEKDELFIFKLTKKRGVGRDLKTANGDCFPLRNPINSTKVCTPNASTTRADTVTKRIEKVRVSKIRTNTVINF